MGVQALAILTLDWLISILHGTKAVEFMTAIITGIFINWHAIIS